VELPSPRRMQSLSVPLPDADSRGERQGGVAPRMRSLSVPLPAVDVADAPPAGDIDLPPTVNGNVLPGVGRTTSVPPSGNGTAAMDAPVSATQIGSGMAGRQSMTLRASRGSFIQRQEGGGNTQILSVESTSGGTVSQQQSGSGNFQSMSIGVTDRRPGPVSGISIQ